MRLRQIGGPAISSRFYATFRTVLPRACPVSLSSWARRASESGSTVSTTGFSFPASTSFAISDNCAELGCPDTVRVRKAVLLAPSTSGSGYRLPACRAPRPHRGQRLQIGSFRVGCCDGGRYWKKQNNRRDRVSTQSCEVEWLKKGGILVSIVAPPSAEEARRRVMRSSNCQDAHTAQNLLTGNSNASVRN
jgi:hypothetical protein